MPQSVAWNKRSPTSACSTATRISPRGAAGDGSAQASSNALGTAGVNVSFESTFDGWGYVHLYEREGNRMTELDTYAIPESHDSHFATGFGDLSVHEVAVSLKDPARAYISYSAGGLRVVEIEGKEIVEKAAFIDDAGHNFWGVQTFVADDGEEYVAASDRDFGLYIFKYTGP